jgi:uncharacterized membrane protein YhaH (DUF805 family)
VTTAPVERSRQPWTDTTHARTERPRPPLGVAIAAGILYVFAVLNLIVALAGLAISVMAVVDGDDSTSWMLPFALAAVAVNGFFALVASKTRRGRRWAWITTLILLSFYALLGLGGVATGLTGGLTDSGAPPLAGLVLVVPTILFILLLTGPRSSREYFRRR